MPSVETQRTSSRAAVRRGLRNALLKAPSIHSFVKRRSLAFQWWRKALHDPDFGLFRRFPPGQCVDIGANAGQSALSFAALCSEQIIAFEANPFLRAELSFVRERIGGRFSFHIVALGAQEGIVEFFVPMAGRTALTQAASTCEDALLRRLETIEENVQHRVSIEKIRVPARTLDSYQLRPAWVKIDVEGAELGVIRGMRRTLESEPVILLERNDESKNVMAELEGYRFFGYRSELDTLVPVSELGTALNYVAIPAKLL